MGGFKKQYLVNGGKPLIGGLRVPGDKSISHRAIILGALADGTTEVNGFLAGADAISTCEIFRQLGVQIDGPSDGRVSITGVGIDGLRASSNPLDCGNAGTGMRLLIGLLSAQAFDSTLIGDESLSQRPMARVTEPLSAMGARIETRNGMPPVRISASKGLDGIHYVLPMASAQVKSSILLAGLFANGKTSVTEPAPTRDHTERMLAGFGVSLSRVGATVSMVGGQRLSAQKIDVPADISSAAFFLVGASITPGSDVTLAHVGLNPTRHGVISVLRAMGANIELSNEALVGGEPIADIRVRYAPLTGIDIDPDVVPLAIDEFPVLFVAAACANGTTRLTGAEELRVKESDRIAAMADGLTTLGVTAMATPDGMVIEGCGQGGVAFGGGEVNSHGDHRIAMAFAMAGLRSSDEIVINDVANVATSFPNFVESCAALGLNLREQSSGAHE